MRAFIVVAVTFTEVRPMVMSVGFRERKISLRRLLDGELL